MELKEFLSNFAEQFEETSPDQITAETEFKSLDEWDSMIAMSVIGITDAIYKVKLTGDDIRNAKTVEDLFLIIRSK